jgi:hypothetical protein
LFDETDQPNGPPASEVILPQIAIYWQRYSTLVLANNITAGSTPPRESKTGLDFTPGRPNKWTDELAYQDAFRIPHFTLRKQEQEMPFPRAPEPTETRLICQTANLSGPQERALPGHPVC